MNQFGKYKCINFKDCGGFCYPPFKICLLCHRYQKSGMDIKKTFAVKSAKEEVVAGS